MRSGVKNSRKIWVILRKRKGFYYTKYLYTETPHVEECLRNVSNWVMHKCDASHHFIR